MDTVERIATRNLTLTYRPAKRLSEVCHELVHGGLFVFVATSPRLPFRECLPREAGKFFVAGAEETDMIEHFRQKTSRVRTSTEPEEVDIVSGGIVPHQETIASHDMIGERRANCRVFCFVVPGFEACIEPCMLEGSTRDIRANAGLIVVESIALRPVKHSVDLQDTTVFVGAAELVPSTIKAEHKRAAGGLRHSESNVCIGST